MVTAELIQKGPRGVKCAKGSLESGAETEKSGAIMKNIANFGAKKPRIYRRHAKLKAFLLYAIPTMSHFIFADRKTDCLLSPSVEGWHNEDHLARFVVEAIDQLDLSGGRGSKLHHPAILVCGYDTSVFTSRKLETATNDSVAFRFIDANSHPDKQAPVFFGGSA